MSRSQLHLKGIPLTSRSRRKKPVEKQAKRKKSRAVARSSFVLAELSYQRGDIGKAMQLLKRLRNTDSKPGFQEENLYGCTLGLAMEFDEAIVVFEKLSHMFKHRVLQYEKAKFNLGLTCLFRDLALFGDLSIAKQSMLGQNLTGNGLLQVKNLENAFEDAITVWNQLLPNTNNYRAIVLTYLAFAYMMKGDLQKALERIQEALSLSSSLYVTQFVAARLFLEFAFMVEDGIGFTLSPETFEFFGCLEEDIIQKEGSRFRVYSDTFIRIAHDFLADALQKNPHAPELHIGLVICYYFLDYADALQQYLSNAEALIPDSKVLRDTVYWLISQSSGSPEEFGQILNRLKEMAKEPNQKHVFHIVAPYYLI
ncbi:MAG: hypothetical protein CR997_11075 [Acidobacteria bacterium]|nr:MAG: hypothetical protein CR997_11075 [Acidobacteriota bacterium]